MASSMKAAIHLGPNYLTKLEVFKNTNFEKIHSLFNITQKLILEHSEGIEFEWIIFPGFSTLQIKKIQDDLREEYRTGQNHRPDHHVNVQRHRLDKERT